MTSQRFLLLLLLLGTCACAVLFWPVVPPLVFGAVVASAVGPLFERLVHGLGGRRRLAAVLFTVLFVVVVVGPLTLALLSVAGDVAEAAPSLRVDALLERLPEGWRARLIPVDPAALQERVASIAGKLVSASGAILKATGSLALALVLLLAALTIFLAERERLHTFLLQHVPLPQDQTAELLDDLHRISSSLVVGNGGTALAQSAVAGVGFLLARAPAPLVFTVVTFALSLLPNVGGAAVTLVAAAIVAFEGRAAAAIFLLLWGLLAVGVVDNVLKPVLMKRGAGMHAGVAFFAIVGGVAAFGPSGLLLGPLIVGFTLATLRIYQRDTNVPPSAPEPTPT